MSTNYCNGHIFVSKYREQRLKTRKIVIVLLNSCIELIHVGKGKHELLSINKHKKLIESLYPDKSTADFRPDIVYQCICNIQNSPLNKFGLVSLYISTYQNLIEVSPQWRAPVSYEQFESIMACLLLNKVIFAKSSNIKLMSLVKADLDLYIPPNCYRIALETSGELVDLNTFILKYSQPYDRKTSKFNLISDLHQMIYDQSHLHENPIVYYIGAIAHGSIDNNKHLNNIEKVIKISDVDLSAAECVNSVICSYEKIWLF